MEHDIPFRNSNRENGPTFLDFPLFVGIFEWDEPTKPVPFTAEPEIPEILTKWKASLVMVFDAILKSRQTCEKLQCLYENPVSNNFRKTAVLGKI